MKRTIKIIFQLTVTLLLIALLASLVTGCMILFRSLGTKGNFTYLIVLGTTVEGTEPSPMLNDRIKAAAKYMEKHPDVIAVVTGGKADDKNISEAQCMYNGLTEAGIASDRILMEDQATPQRKTSSTPWRCWRKNWAAAPITSAFSPASSTCCAHPSLPKAMT